MNFSIKFFVPLTLILLITSCVAPNKKEETTEQYTLKSVNFEELSSIILRENDSLYVVNFWATWCKPCIEELPDFMEIQKQFKDTEAFKMILVSLDRQQALEEVLPNFLQNHAIQADVYLLDDITRMNEWIPAIDPSWTGAIPATVFIKNSERKAFHEGVLHKEELHTIITKLL